MSGNGLSTTGDKRDDENQASFGEVRGARAVPWRSYDTTLRLAWRPDSSGYRSHL